MYIVNAFLTVSSGLAKGLPIISSASHSAAATIRENNDWTRASYMPPVFPDIFKFLRMIAFHVFILPTPPVAPQVLLAAIDGMCGITSVAASVAQLKK
jgi:hypothetical protein